MLYGFSNIIYKVYYVTSDTLITILNDVVTMIPKACNEEKIIISCVTFETSMIIEPVKYYNGKKAHLIHYVREDSQYRNIYQRFYDEVEKQLSDINNIEVVEHISKVYDYNIMLHTILNILEMENKHNCQILINISSGTSEYIAAAMYAAMITPGVIPFTVRTKRYTVDDDEVERLFFENGKPVGMTREVSNPTCIKTFYLDPPSEELIKCLGTIRFVNENRLPSSCVCIIEQLKKYEIWSYVMKSENKKTSQSQKEVMYCKRHYLEPMLNKGWIVKDQLKNRYIITNEGNVILDVFLKN